jgi:anti-sigma factor RsiW
MIKHYSEAELLETYYLQPGESMPAMMHLASCPDCAAKYERLERKLREAAVCSTEKPDTFWSRQRLSIMRRLPSNAAKQPLATWRIAAATILAFALGGAVVYKSVEPKLNPQPVVVAAAPATVEPADDDETLTAEPWESDELDDFRPVVQWESWVAETNASNGETSL